LQLGINNIIQHHFYFNAAGRYQEGTLVFLALGQVAGMKSYGGIYQQKGYALVFHADLLHGTSLAIQMQAYSFFGYHSSEAQHLSER
jgi:hypothetical protein